MYKSLIAAAVLFAACQATRQPESEPRAEPAVEPVAEPGPAARYIGAKVELFGAT